MSLRTALGVSALWLSFLPACATGSAPPTAPPTATSNPAGTPGDSTAPLTPAQTQRLADCQQIFTSDPTAPKDDYSALCTCAAVTYPASAPTDRDLWLETLFTCLPGHNAAWAPAVPPAREPVLASKASVAPRKQKLPQLEQAENLQDAEKFAEAEPIYQKLRATHPKDPDIAYHHATNLAQLDRLDASLTELESAAKLGYIDYPVACNETRLGIAAFSSRYRAVMQQLREAYRQHPPPSGTPAVFVPKTPAPTGGYPSVVLLHGYGDTNASYFDEAEAWSERGVLAIALPGSLPRSNGSFIWDEFDSETTHRQVQAALSSKLVKPLVNRDSIFLLGFSQGAQHALSLLRSHTQSYRGVLALSPGGSPDAFATDAPLPTARGRAPRVVLIAGRGEPTVLPHARAIADLGGSAGWRVELLTHPGGHHFPAGYASLEPLLIDFLLGRTESVELESPAPEATE